MTPRSIAALVSLAAVGLAVAAGPVPAAPGGKPAGGPDAADAGIGATRVARWKDDKKAAFLLMFDDSMPSQVKHVVPELRKRNLVATFYVNPGKGEWKAFAAAWEKDIPAAGMEYANHTMTHKGVKDAADAEREIGGCNDVILGLFPDGKKPTLISFGQPGVAKGAWNLTADELRPILARHRLIDRPPFEKHGAMVHVKTADDMIRLADAALAAGGVEYVVFHGVGGDWIATPLPVFLAFLDGLETRRGDLWIAGHIAAHKYATERDAADVKVTAATGREIRLALTCKADRALYDAPLTLVTRVPDDWKKCQVEQGGRRVAADVRDGHARYDATPDGQPVTIRAAAE